MRFTATATLTLLACLGSLGIPASAVPTPHAGSVAIADIQAEAKAKAASRPSRALPHPALPANIHAAAGNMTASGPALGPDGQSAEPTDDRGNVRSGNQHAGWLYGRAIDLEAAGLPSPPLGSPAPAAHSEATDDQGNVKSDKQHAGWLYARHAEHKDGSWLYARDGSDGSDGSDEPVKTDKQHAGWLYVRETDDDDGAWLPVA